MSDIPIIASPLGIRQTSEAAWLAWIKTKASPGTPLAAANFFEGQSTQEIVLPAVVVAANTAKELLAPGSGYWEVDVDFLVMSSPDTGSDADKFQAELVGQLEGILYGSSPGDTPSIETIAAEVSSNQDIHYSVYGFWIEDQNGQAVERHWIDQIKLKVHCTPNSGLMQNIDE